MTQAEVWGRLNCLPSCEGGGGTANKREASGNLPPSHWWEVRGLLQQKEEPTICFKDLGTLAVGTSPALPVHMRGGREINPMGFRFPSFKMGLGDAWVA